MLAPRWAIVAHWATCLIYELTTAYKVIPLTHVRIHNAKGYLINTGPDPMENHKGTKPAFNVRPPSARQQNAI